jgi:hypothetical protein
MTIAKCTENGLGQPQVDFTLVEGATKHGPYIDFELPFEWLSEEYTGAGVFYFNLDDLLKEFINTYWDNSHGELTPRLIKLLREYADKIEQDLELREK